MPQSDTSFDPLSYAQSKLNETNTDINFDPLEYANSKLAEDTIKTGITNKVAMSGEPSEGYVDNITNFFKDMYLHSQELKTSVYRGAVKGVVTSPLKFVADITDSPDMKTYLEDAEGTLDKLFVTSKEIGDVGETLGRVGGGLMATGGLGLATIPARIAQGFTVDLLSFDEKSGNIADVFDKHDIDLGGVVDVLKSNEQDSAIEARLKNSFANLPVAMGTEALVAGLMYGRTLLKSNNSELTGTNEEVMSTVMSTLKEDANTMASKVKQVPIDEQPVVTKAQVNEGQALYDRATEMIKDVPSNYDELIAKGESIINTDTNTSIFKISNKLEGEAGVPYAERILKENNVSSIDEKKFWDIKGVSNTTEEALTKFDKYMKSKEFRTPEDYKTIDFQYHGTSNEITTLKNGNVTDTNIYGDGFYTTNKAEIASSYTKKGKGASPTVYKVEEVKPINNLDLDNTKVDNNVFDFNSLDVGISTNNSIREAIDKFRTESSLPKYEVTDIIDSIQQAYSKQGFNSWSHKGGEATNSAGHNVKIYFNPKDDIKITKVTPEEIKANIDAFNKSRSANKAIDVTLNMKQPLNAEVITPTNATTLAKATQGIEADASFISHENLLKQADKDLKDKLGQDGYELVNDLTATATNVENLSLKVTQSRVVVGNLAQKYQEALVVAQKEGGAEATMRAMLALDNLVSTSKILKNTTSTIAKAMSAMRINTEDSQLFNSLKIMDNIDTDYSMSLLRDAMSKGDNETVLKLMDNFSDTTKKLKDHVDNYQEGLFKKIGNVLSESVVAGMLSAPSTLAVNVIGNTYVKHQRLLRDTLQYVTGKVLRNSDRMKDREFKYLLSANIGSNFNDIRIVGKNLKDWAKSGFKDETFDEAVLARFVQDQEFSHKYISSQYIRGLEVGNQASLANTSINTFGKLARSPYKIIGAVDDYYKRSAFRSELVRVGSRLADVRNIPDAEYDKFMDKFIRINTELHILRNNGHKPTTTFLKQNKDYIGTGDGLFKYADEARDHANYMTFQSELKGAIGKGVDFLNSDGFLRILVPFKLTPINMLKQSLSTVHDLVRASLYKDIFVTGGIKRDIAIAKLAYSSSVMLGVGALIQSGNMTGSFKKEERVAMQSAGIPEYSYRIGNTWYEYKQLEPVATIAGVMTDLFRLQQDAMLRSDDIPADEIGKEVQGILADVGMSIVNNIVNKTYAKSLSDTLGVINGDTSLIDYSGNLVSSAVPFSSLSNFIGREFGDGYKKEASEFTDKIFSKYRVLLERDALDAYGRPIKEVDYSPLLTKEMNANLPENKGAIEVARLGINLHKMSKTVSYQGISVELKPEEYWIMRRNLDTKFKLSDRINSIVDSDSYKAQSDYVRTQMLTNVINQIKIGASQTILTEPRVLNKIQEGATKLIKNVNETVPKATYNTMILGGKNE